MRIGKIAAAAGVTIPTLRFYERRGLLPPPVRADSGYRVYSEEAARRVRFIKQSQELGFSLGEIAELLALREQRSGNAAEVRALAQGKLQQIEEKLARLHQMRAELQHILTACDCVTTTTHCPILTEMNGWQPPTTGATDAD